MGHRNLAIATISLAICLHCQGLQVSALDKAQDSDDIVASPSGQLEFRLLDRDPALLRYEVVFGGHKVIEESKIGLHLDGANLGENAIVNSVERYEANERYPSRGVHSTALNHFRGTKFRIHNKQSNTDYLLDVRAFDDGVAFRHIVPGEGSRVPDAASEFTIPKGSMIWHHGLRGHYEGVHVSQPIESLAADEWIAPPLTFKLRSATGYAAITEASLVSYAGMAFETAGNCVLRERLGHSQPVGHPFALRFGKQEAERLSHAAAVDGEIVTPWRVVLVGKDLNTLVNSDIIQNLSSPPDGALCPQGLQTPWIKPGRCVWKFLDGGTSDLQGMMEFSQFASKLGFEYNLIEGFWQRWDEADLRSLVDYSRKQNVGIWLWKDSRALHAAKDRERFFSLCQRTGVVGVKIDFLDHEAKEVIDLYCQLMKEAAQHRLMLNFHGANKPTGESRTWPNELTREGIRGLEGGQIKLRSRHDATLPFTRYLAGPADYTPVVFGPRRGDTTAAHQIATAAVFTSPLLVYGAHPKSLLEHPAVEMIKSVPSVWDETIALPGSEIGRVAAFARRHGDDWFLAVLGGPDSQKLTLSLSFLDSSAYHAMLVRDDPKDPTAVKIEKLNLTSADSLPIDLADGGGFIGRFSPQVPRYSAVGRSQE
jgi:alpha-glucosidase